MYQSDNQMIRRKQADNVIIKKGKRPKDKQQNTKSNKAKQ